MAYFEMSIINSINDRHEFDIQVNEELYNYFTGHENAQINGEDWFDIRLNLHDVKEIKRLCRTNEEKELIGKNIQIGSIIDILIHRTILIKEG